MTVSPVVGAGNRPLSRGSRPRAGALTAATDNARAMVDAATASTCQALAQLNAFGTGGDSAIAAAAARDYPTHDEEPPT